MDAFYASVEILDNPSLRGLPLVIGGDPKSRSVVSTASYEARKFGIRSAMSCSEAYRRCPSAVFLPPRFDRYRDISQQIRKIFFRYTDLVEPLSLDEAYLDVTNSPCGLYATQIARKIKDEILAEVGLTCSAGVAPNKLVAKIASDFQKPNGLVVVTPDKVQKFMHDLPVRKIHGVGPATEKRLAEFDLFKCSDITARSREDLDSMMGKHGVWIWHAAHGHDDRPVETNWERQSYGREDTFPKDLLSIESLSQKVRELSQEVSELLCQSHQRGRTITLKVKYFDFRSVTRSKSLTIPTNDAETISNIALSLLAEKTDAGKIPIRLTGVSMSNLEDAKPNEFSDAPSPSL
jgi:DNA polymerase-4